MSRRVEVDQLVGAAEIAERLGLTYVESVHTWRRRHPDFPTPVAQLKQALIWYWPDVEAWAGEFKKVQPLVSVAEIPPRPLLLLHGSDDPTVPVSDARALADAAGGEADMRVITGAGHRLRHDPRAVAALMGWMERQGMG